MQFSDAPMWPLPSPAPATQGARARRLTHGGAYDPHAAAMPGASRDDGKALPLMATYQHAAPAPARTDIAAWALVALIVAMICAGAGWAIARNDVPGNDDLARTSELAARDGVMRGQASGYSEGARLGRTEARLQTKAATLAARQQAQREGYQAGYASGRAKAGDPDAFLSSTLGTGSYPDAAEEMMASSLFGTDATGFADSAYGASGYGANTSMPYMGSTAPGASLLDY